MPIRRRQTLEGAREAAPQRRPPAGPTTAPMLLNFIWLAFFVSAFAVALVRLAMGGLEVFPRPLAAMFDLARTDFVVCIGEDGGLLVGGYHS
jgi:hypothetical protein